jgi:tRNA(Ile2) C34 agmatinyltransferase TiaS
MKVGVKVFCNKCQIEMLSNGGNNFVCTTCLASVNLVVVTQG